MNQEHQLRNLHNDLRVVQLRLDYLLTQAEHPSLPIVQEQEVSIKGQIIMNQEQQLLLAVQHFLLYREQLQDLREERGVEVLKIRRSGDDALRYKHSCILAKIRSAKHAMKDAAEEITELLVDLGDLRG